MVGSSRSWASAPAIERRIVRVIPPLPNAKIRAPPPRAGAGPARNPKPITDAARRDDRQIRPPSHLLQQRKDLQVLLAADAAAFRAFQDQAVDPRVLGLQRLRQRADLVIELDAG